MDELVRFFAIGVFVVVVGFAAYGGLTSGIARQNPNNVAFGLIMLAGLAALAWELKSTRRNRSTRHD